jgi:hypothetical protein
MPLASKWIPQYYDKFIRQLESIMRREGRNTINEYQQLYRMLKATECKRMMFDARQIAVFDQSDPIKLEGDKIRAPFGLFWMEMTEPIKVAAQQPGYEDDLYAIVFMENCFPGHNVLTPTGMKKVDVSQVIFIFYNEERDQWVDRSFCMSLSEKKAYTTRKIVEGANKWQGSLPHYIEHQGSDPGSHPVNVVSDHIYKEPSVRVASNAGLFQAGMQLPDQENRTPSWWEECIQDHTDLLLWVLAYCMAKSIRIEELRMPRQQVRAMERKGIVPRPWHRVFVEPKLIYKQLPGGEDTGRTVGHRFDVIGHLRFNKHKLASGAYRHTVEWVPDHQRGLENEIYIPKTYAVAKSSKTVPENQQYFGEEAKKL